MKKSTLNFIINAIMFIVMSALAGIGFLLKYQLISGKERWIVYGDNYELFFLGLDRHQWGMIHLILGFILLGLLVLHIIFNWNMVTCVYCKLIHKSFTNKLFTILFIGIGVLLMIIPFFISPQIGDPEHKGGKHGTNHNNDVIEHNTSVAPKNNAKTKHLDNSRHNNSDMSIRGFMTLKDVSVKYNIPTETLKTKLGIPSSVSDDEKLSMLKRKYNFEMSEVKEIVTK